MHTHLFVTPFLITSFPRTPRRIRRVKSITPHTQSPMNSLSAPGTPRRSLSVTPTKHSKQAPILSSSDITSILSSVSEDKNEKLVPPSHRKNKSIGSSPFNKGTVQCGYIIRGIVIRGIIIRGIHYY